MQLIRLKSLALLSLGTTSVLLLTGGLALALHARQEQPSPRPPVAKGDSSVTLPTLSTVQNGLKRRQERIKNIYVRSTRTFTADVDPKLLLQWKLAGAESVDHWEIAFKGMQRYLRWTKPKDIISFDGELIPAKEAAAGFDEKTMWLRDSEADGKANVVPLEYAGWFDPQLMFYFCNVGICPPGVTTKGKEESRFWRLPELLVRGSYRVERTETVDGASCVVVRGVVSAPPFRHTPAQANVEDTLWLDSEHGWVLRKRELRAEGVLWLRYHNTAFKQVAPEVWLPQECVYQHGTPPSAPKELRDKPAVTGRIKVQEVRVNDVSDTLFARPPDDTP